MSLLAIAMSLLLVTGSSSCTLKKTAGIKKDLNTGLTSTYNNIKSESVRLEMNNEVLNHTDIPLGESFFLVNENVTGMEVKDGKVSAGC